LCLVLLASVFVRLTLGLALSAFLCLLLVLVIIREARSRRALADARALQNDLRLAIDTIPTIVWSTRPDGTVDFMNRAWRDFTGISADAATRGHWVESLHPDESSWVQSERSAAIAAGR